MSVLPFTLTLLLRSPDIELSCAADLGRGLAVFSGCLGELFALPGLDVRAEDRGVMLAFVRTSLSGVLVCFALGVGGSDLIVGVAREPAGLVGGVALPLTATRGAFGVRAVRVDANDGLSGRLVLDDLSEEAIGPSRYKRRCICVMKRDPILFSSCLYDTLFKLEFDPLCIFSARQSGYLSLLTVMSQDSIAHLQISAGCPYSHAIQVANDRSLRPRPIFRRSGLISNVVHKLFC